MGITLVDVHLNWLNKDVYGNSFFPRTARLWISSSIECFRLTFNL